MTGPLVPVPDLPHRVATGASTYIEARPALRVEQASLAIGSPDQETYDLVTPEQAPDLAAAILVAAGCEHVRVIDLGAPLPTVSRDTVGAVTKDVYGATRQWDQAYLNDWPAVLRDLMHTLALVTTPPVPPHDPAAVEAVRRVLLDTRGDAYDDAGDDRGLASLILDALAVVRAEATP